MQLPSQLKPIKEKDNIISTTGVVDFVEGATVVI